MITINARNFPTYFQDGILVEPLFLKPDGERTRYPIGWQGKGRYEAGTLRVWRDGQKLAPGTDYTEEANGVFFNFLTPPPASAKYSEYTIVYVPRAADLAFARGETTGDEMFLFPNWLGGSWIGDAFWVGRHLASKSDATAASGGSTTIPTSRSGVVPWCNVTFDAAYTAIASKGTGWHIVRNREWANIAKWCIHHDIYPTGNSVSGSDGMGVAHTPDPTVSGRALTSTGPVTSAHNLREDGIFDLVGNTWEWIDGLQLVSGTLYLADETGNMVSTGIKPTFGTSGGSFNFLRADFPLELVPAISGEAYRGTDGFWFDTAITAQAFRGGYWGGGPLGGLCALGLSSPRSYSGTTYGFRLACSLTI